MTLRQWIFIRSGFQPNCLLWIFSLYLILKGNLGQYCNIIILRNRRVHQFWSSDISSIGMPNSEHYKCQGHMLHRRTTTNIPHQRQNNGKAITDKLSSDCHNLIKPTPGFPHSQNNTISLPFSAHLSSPINQSILITQASRPYPQTVS